MKHPIPAVFAMLLLALAFSSSPVLAAECGSCSPGKDADPASSETEMSKFEKDRQAILAMAGEYEITFQFQETVPIEEGYELRDPYRTTATELVEVVEDAGTFISLQHVLVLHGDAGEAPRVVKHWRQDWTYQDTRITAFRGDRTWTAVEVDPQRVEGTWSQAVFQVDDSPRYEGFGHWTHVGGRSAWESDDTWRPMPRRDATKRSDYDVLVSRNRHVITPSGWVHEQDSHKLVLDKAGQPAAVLVHESGLNVYDRVDNVDFTAGREYWRNTAAYWQDVRAVWADLFDDTDRMKLKGKVDGERLGSRLFAMAEQAAEGEMPLDPQARRSAIRDEIKPYVVSQ